jgi:transcriptional regulator with XRE-family HTH domain
VKAAHRAVPAPQSFRDALREQLAARCASNPRYSLRAFANYLGVHHSTLSQMLRGKRTVSAAAIEKFGARLGLAPAEIATWVERERQRPPGASSRQRQVTELARDTAEVLDDWRNFAILELTRLEQFQPDSRWIARMLGITVDEVNVAISRLCRLRLLQMASDGRWHDLLGDATLDLDHFSDAAVASLFARTRELTVADPYSSAVGRSEHSSATLAVPSTLVGEAVGRLASFRSEFLAWLASGDHQDAVYHLEIRFVPLTAAGDQEQKP